MSKKDKRNPILYKEIECTPTEFKEFSQQLQKQGIVIDSLSFEPTKFKYKVYHYAEDSENADLTKEIWKDMDGGFFGVYQISSLGRIRSIKVISKFYDRTTLTDSDGKRHHLNIRKLYSEYFPNQKIEA